MTNLPPNMATSHPPRFAVIFPGQGSQSVGMLSDWADRFPQILHTFQEASDILGFDLWAICQGQHEKFCLDETAYTQPALLTASMAIWQVLQQELNFKPSYLAGHSLGEYSALCASEVLSFTDAVRLVHLRGQFMSQAMQQTKGKMSAVLGLADEQVQSLCEQIMDNEQGAIVSPANYNAPNQVVIAGKELGVDLAVEQLTNLGKRSILLKVSVPSHCALMKPATEKLAEQLQQITFLQPKIPIIQNRHARVELGIQEMKQALIEQLSESVLWSKTQDKLADKHIQLQIECGSGNVLTNLAKRQQHKIETIATDKVCKLLELKEIFS